MIESQQPWLESDTNYTNVVHEGRTNRKLHIIRQALRIHEISSVDQ
jgi:hypothetical protein